VVPFVLWHRHGWRSSSSPPNAALYKVGHIFHRILFQRISPSILPPCRWYWGLIHCFTADGRRYRAAAWIFLTSR
jgi:hypothetical protein